MKEPATASKHRFHFMTAIGLRVLPVLLLVFSAMVLSDQAAEFGESWKITERDVENGGSILKLAIQPPENPSQSLPGLKDARKMLIAVSDHELSYEPDGAPNLAFKLSTSDTNEIGSLIKLLKAFEKACKLETEGESYRDVFVKEARKYSGHFGPVDPVIQLGGTSSEYIAFSKTDDQGNKLLLHEPNGLLWALRNLSAFPAMRKAETEKQIVLRAKAEQEATERRADQLELEKKDAGERLAQFERAKRDELASDEQKSKIKDIKDDEAAAKVAIQNKLESETREKLREFAKAPQGKLLLGSIRQTENAVISELEQNRARVAQQAKPLDDRLQILERALQITVNAGKRAEILDDIGETHIAKQLIVNAAGNINVTSHDAHLAELKTEFAKLTGYKYDAVAKLLPNDPTAKDK